MHLIYAAISATCASFAETCAAIVGAGDALVFACATPLVRKRSIASRWEEWRGSSASIAPPRDTVSRSREAIVVSCASIGVRGASIGVRYASIVTPCASSPTPFWGAVLRT